MPIPFPSDPWIKALMAELNANPAYQSAAKNWEGDLIFIIEPGGRLAQPVTLYMDLWHGQCRDAFVVDDSKPVDPVFRLSGPVEIWKKVITRELDVIHVLMTGKLKVRGNLAAIMRSVKAAQELVATCARVETEFPL
jgi:putative sterol carrier protein